ncbi:MAG: HEAT repeat domain-containing protein [Lachnospiraceae bacterium]|jgi:hypothetical protein|nr:HEAT repeat domain-containing protein [Lachnospiraceae bacterium]MCH4027585.1 HEAT repeat domain-containing protein [Lachnospiraceae bacterium]MCH4065425.1 HEAT repeat domain-containing protein [Lachnospiraceae bacterium]MCH4111465.1 HEAT repeat domain-containing protein [Lachnospiraceae bacterium]MCI1353061.1 HEAT repeat domain-containing protein [Lachnospiraceae bacterium]
MFFGGNPEEKIEKLEEKGNSKKIIELIHKKGTSKEVVLDGIKALGKLAEQNDEDSTNCLTDLLDSDDPEIVVAAAKAGIETGSDYMKTRIQQLIANEKDQKVVEEIREAYHNKYFAND